MISYKDCLNYIENILPNYPMSLINFKVGSIPIPKNIELSDSQKKLLKNLIEGKVTNCPRCMGKTFVIQLYADYLNYVHDNCKYNSDIVCEDYISGVECIDTPLSQQMIKNGLYQNKEKAMEEYNIPEEYVGMYIIPEEKMKEFSLGN